MRRPWHWASSSALDTTVLERVREATSFVTKLGLTLALVIGYLLIAVASTTHEILVMPDRTMKLPIFDTEVSVFGFFVCAPLLLVGLHGYFLTERLRLALSLRELWPPEVSEPALTAGKGSPVFVPVFLFRDPLLKRSHRWWHRAFGLALVLLTLIPVAVLLFIQWTYLPAHAWFESGVHKVLFTLDLLVVSAAYLLTYHMVCRKEEREGFRRRATIPAVGCTLLLLVSWFGLSSPPAVERWAHLDLARFEPRLSDPHLGRVRFRVADLTAANFHAALLDGVDLSGCDLSHADLADAMLRGADLRGADLDAADLRGADFTGANLAQAVLRAPRLRAPGLPEPTSKVPISQASSHRTAISSPPTSPMPDSPRPTCTKPTCGSRTCGGAGSVAPTRSMRMSTAHG